MPNNDLVAGVERAEYMRNVRLNLRYGISVEQYEEMLHRQNGVCAICERPEQSVRKGKLLRLAVDHDHATGRVRGLLCHRCNISLARLGDQPDTIRRVLAYLEED